jgi:hypothetical protein
MVAVGEDATAAPHDAIDGTSETRADRHHAASERLAVLRLDDEMGVIALQGVVHEAESPARAAFGEGALDGADDTDRAKRGQTLDHTYRHMRRTRAAKVHA